MEVSGRLLEEEAIMQRLVVLHGLSMVDLVGCQPLLVDRICIKVKIRIDDLIFGILCSIFY